MLEWLMLETLLLSKGSRLGLQFPRDSNLRGRAVNPAVVQDLLQPPGFPGHAHSSVQMERAFSCLPLWWLCPAPEGQAALFLPHTSSPSAWINWQAWWWCVRPNRIQPELPGMPWLCSADKAGKKRQADLRKLELHPSAEPEPRESTAAMHRAAALGWGLGFALGARRQKASYLPPAILTIRSGRGESSAAGAILLFVDVCLPSALLCRPTGGPRSSQPRDEDAHTAPVGSPGCPHAHAGMGNFIPNVLV